MTKSCRAIKILSFIVALTIPTVTYTNCSAPGSLDGDNGELNIPIEGINGYGELVFISEAGKVTGWAKDRSSEDKVVLVTFYAGNPSRGGERIGAVAAKDLGANTSINGHYFNFTLPRQYSDGQLRTLYVYAGEIKDANIVDNGIRPYQSFAPSPEGLAYYNSTLQPLMAADCSECHATTTYNTFYFHLFSPSPFTASKTNNALINAANGNGHQGGNRCPGGRNSSPCLEMQTWWDIEFN